MDNTAVPPGEQLPRATDPTQPSADAAVVAAAHDRLTRAVEQVGANITVLAREAEHFVGDCRRRGGVRG